MKNATKLWELTAGQTMGVLSTMSKRQAGYPFGSVVAYALDGQARPVLLISALAVHFKNLQSDSKGSLTVFEDEALSNPMTAARATLMGEFHPVPESELAVVKAAYLARHPEAERWANFGDFAFLRMDIRDIYYIGGFGSMGWILPEDYRAASGES